MTAIRKRNYCKLSSAQRFGGYWRRAQSTMTHRLISLVLIGGGILLSTVLMPLIYLGGRHPLLALVGGLALTIVGFVLARSDRFGPPRSRENHGIVRAKES